MITKQWKSPGTGRRTEDKALVTHPASAYTGETESSVSASLCDAHPEKNEHSRESHLYVVAFGSDSLYFFRKRVPLAGTVPAQALTVLSAARGVVMPTIALIDDDPDIVEANRLLLESHGYRVVTAGCVDEAIKIVSHEKPDLIILDVMMQEADDGFYLASRFRRGGLTVPIIMLTSLTRAIGFNFGESASVPIQEFLEKPTAPAVLLEKIQRHLARVRPH